MKTFKKALSLLLVFIMCLSTVPFATSAIDVQYDGQWMYSVENGYAVLRLADTSVTGDVTIPSKLGGYTVKIIGEGALNNLKTVTSITIPDCVTTIEADAFKLNSLQSVKIGKGVTIIGKQAFFYCTSLKSVSIPANVIIIDESAFSNCTSLTSVTIGNGVTTIGKNAFKNCYKLNSVTIGNSVTTIGNSAFSDCESLTSVTIPNSVTTISSYAFMNCKNITRVNLGKNVALIDYAAFSNCTNLKNVYYSGNTKDWNSITIKTGNAALTDASRYILGTDLITPIIPSNPDTPSDPSNPSNPDNPNNPNNPNNPSNPGGSDNLGSSEDCSCKCHLNRGVKRFFFRVKLLFQRIFRKNQVCACGALHYQTKLSFGK